MDVVQTAKDRAGKPRARLAEWWAWGLVMGILAFTAVIRVRFLGMPLARDEGEYAYAGQLILQGIPPYKLAYNMKLPGVYAAYALIMAVFGQTTVGIRLGMIIVNAASIILMFLLGRRLFDTVTGVAAAASYAVLSVSPTVLGLWAHASHFVVLAAVAGMLLLLQACESGRVGTFVGSGILFGLAFVAKQHGIFFVLFGLSYLSWIDWRTRSASGGRFLRRVTAFAAGAIAPFAATAFILLIAGVFGKFWFWTFTYAREYVSQATLAEGLKLFLISVQHVIGPVSLLWTLAGFGSLALFGERGRSVAFVLSLLVFSLLSISPGLCFRLHYFVQVLPVAALLIGVAMRSLGQVLARVGLPVALQRGIPCLLIFTACYVVVSDLGDYLFHLSPPAASRVVFVENPFPESVQIGEYIRQRTKPEARIAVLGSEPQVFFYARRHSASGYIYMYELMEKHKYALTMRQEMIAEIEAAKSEYLVFVNVAMSWMKRPDPKKFIVDWYRQYAQDYYDLVGVVDIVSMERTEYRWAEQAKNYRPRSPHFVLVHKRKTA